MRIKLHFEEDELRFIPTQEEIRKMILFVSDEPDLKTGIEKIVIEPSTDTIPKREEPGYDKVLLGYGIKAYSRVVCKDRYVSRSSLG